MGKLYVLLSRLQQQGLDGRDVKSQRTKQSLWRIYSVCLYLRVIIKLKLSKLIVQFAFQFTLCFSPDCSELLFALHVRRTALRRRQPMRRGPIYCTYDVAHDCCLASANWFANKKEDGFSHTGNVRQCYKCIFGHSIRIIEAFTDHGIT